MQDYKIDMDMEIVIFYIYIYIKVKKWSQYKSKQQFQLLGLVWCLRIEHNINCFDVTNNTNTN